MRTHTEERRSAHNARALTRTERTSCRAVVGGLDALDALDPEHDVAGLLVWCMREVSNGVRCSIVWRACACGRAWVRAEWCLMVCARSRQQRS